MFKVGDKVRVVAGKNRLWEISLGGLSLTGMIGPVEHVSPSNNNYDVAVKEGGGTWCFETQDLELVETEAEAQRAFDPYLGTPSFEAHPEGVLQVKDTEGQPPICTFDTGVMTLERFDALVDYIVEKRIKAVMCAKSAEYAQGKNKLHNFDRAATMRGISSLEALRGMKLKHEVSIEDMLDGLKDGKTYPRELWEEKFTDNINYQILEWAILARDNGWDKPVDRTEPTEGGY